MFIGRETELQELERLYQTDTFQMPVIYGRRRVGKSTLIRKFISGKRAVLFTAVESNEKKNLELFSNSIYRSLVPELGVLPPFPDFEAAFDFLKKYMESERLILVIDEYPYLAASDKSISSRLQSYIDNEWKDSRLFLILCGSSMSFMERQVLGYQSPLYGRRTAQFKIQPFDYRASGAFVPDYSPEEKAIVYGVTGGIPKYLELFDQSVSVYKNIIRLYFTESGYLYEEPSNLLKQELRDVSSYNAVLEAVAGGANRLTEIVTKTRMDGAMVSYCLKSLMEIGIVKKDTAVTEEKNRKKSLYVVGDTMFRFWYRFVPDATGLILQQQGELYFEEAVKPQLPDFMGKIFEEMSRDFCLKMSASGKFPFSVLRMGRWWGTDRQEKQEAEIDLVGINQGSKELMLGECKYQNQEVKISALKQLVKRAALFPGYHVRGFILCAKSGFSDEVKQSAGKEGALLFTLEDMYKQDRCKEK